MEVTDIQYKESEIGVIPIDWEVKPLEELCRKKGLVRGPFGGALKKEFFVRDGIKVYEQQNAIYRDFSLGDYFIDLKKFEELSRFEVKPNDFIVSCSGTIGRIFMIPINAPKGIINQALLKITIDESIVKKQFFLHYFEWDEFQLKIIDSTQGGAMKNLVGMAIFRDTKFAVPSKSEQTAIATALSDTDALIENLEKLIAKKRNIKQGVMQELLTGRKRLAGFSTEWRYSTLSKFVADKKFAIVDGPFGSQMKVQDFVEQGIPIVEMEHLKNKFLEPDKLDRYITHKKFEELIRSSVFPDDIIISKTGSLGYISIVPSSIEKALITSRLAKITLDKKKANISFVFQCLTRLREIEYWQRTAQGGTMLILSIANISHAPIPDISIYEQKEIADILDTMDNDIERLEQILYKYNMIKHGMMQALLTGKIRLI